MIINIKQFFLFLFFTASFVFGVNVIYSWTAPTAIPPNANAPVPINIGPNTQVKSAALGLDGNLLVLGNSIFYGKVTISNGKGAGRYLTSDAEGNATWQQLP